MRTAAPWRELPAPCPRCFAPKNCRNARARTGFDWPDTDGVYAKIAEELEEVRAAETAEHRAEEIGDLLFAVVNLARHMKVDAESALRAAQCKIRAQIS
jgi:ATP diphosphatase